MELMSLPPEQHPFVRWRTPLLRQARTALVHGVRHGRPPGIMLEEWPFELREVRATFVTLEKGGKLRGCIGHLEATQPLVVDITENAVAAAIHDPRFPPVSEDEMEEITMSLSILTPPEPLEVTDEAGLRACLRPGVDGLILREGRRQATFLPSVWEELPSVEDFLRHLKYKGGWAPDYWSARMAACRYQADYLSETD